MAYFNGPLSKRFQCPICLGMFTDPVTTSCGHNFCKSCTEETWNFTCPFCKNITINTTLRDVISHYKKKESPLKPEVLCDACKGIKMKALKSCLDCGATFCKTHLEPHDTIAKFKKHKLIDPVENLEEYICQKHDRAVELFCRDDQTCVCLCCTEGDHRNHYTVPIEEENRERKAQLAKKQTDVQLMIHERIKKIQELKVSAENNRKSTDKEKSDSVEVFTALICSIERCQAELLEVMEEKQKAAEKQAEDLIKELQQEITELQRRDTELEQLSHTEDHLHLLQIYPSLCSPLNTRNWTEISIDTPYLSVKTLRKALTQLQEILDEKLSETELRRMQKYAVDVTMDPHTAHPYLILSYDGKQVNHGYIKHGVPDNPKTCVNYPNVLGREGISLGRCYYEVQVNNKTDWTLGFAAESIDRKSENTLNPRNGYWTVWLRNGNHYSACDDPPVRLYLKVKPQKVGLFVDYEEGLVSFYDVESRSHIYSYTGQSFTEKLYPFFSPGLTGKGKNSAPLIISPKSSYCY